MPYRKVVIGVDFTDASLSAARWVARRFAPNAEIVLVHALPQPDAPSYLRSHLPAPAELTAALAPVLYGGLRGLAGLIGTGRARIYMAVGRPADVLARAARQFGADLVCVARGARRRGGARFGATTGVRLLARTRVPTLIVPAGTRGTPSHIAAALDDRPGSERIVATACCLASAYEAYVDAVLVVEEELVDIARTAAAIAVRKPGDRETGIRGERSTGSRSIHELAQDWVERMLDDADAVPTRSAAVIRGGDAGQAVLAHAVAHSADLVVIGRGGDATHTAVPAGALVVGSTTRLVTWAAPCPVLVVSLDGTPVTSGDTTAAGQSGVRSRTARPPATVAQPGARGDAA